MFKRSVWKEYHSSVNFDANSKSVIFMPGGSPDFIVHTCTQDRLDKSRSALAVARLKTLK